MFELKYNAIHDAKLFEALSKIHDDSSLACVLEEMAANDTKNAEDNILSPKDIADLIIAEVESYENVRNEIQENVSETMQKVFDSLSPLELNERIDIMNQMLFGFELCSNEKELEKLKNGISGESLYHMENDKTITYSDRTELLLRHKLIEKAASLRLSPAALKRMSNSLCYTDDYVTTAATLGADSRSLKCVVAMDLYLRNHNQVSIDEAALNACMYADIGAIADAVRVGEIAETVSLALMAVRIITFAVKAVSLITAASTLGEIITVVLVAWGLMEATEMVGKFISRQIGKAATIGSHLIKEGFERIRNAAEDEECNDNTWCFSDEEHIHNLETEADYIF